MKSRLDQQKSMCRCNQPQNASFPAKKSSKAVFLWTAIPKRFWTVSPDLFRFQNGSKTIFRFQIDSKIISIICCWNRTQKNPKAKTTIPLNEEGSEDGERKKVNESVTVILPYQPTTLQNNCLLFFPSLGNMLTTYDTFLFWFLEKVRATVTVWSFFPASSKN